MSDNNKVVKTIELSKDEFAEISPEKDLQNIIDECSKILDECGYSDHVEAVNKGRKTSEAFYFAGNAILHAKSALEEMTGHISNDAVFNAMKAVHFQNLATMQHIAIERDTWAGMKATKGAKNEEQLRFQLEQRKKYVEICRVRGKMESMIPRYVAAMEGGFSGAGGVPKRKVDSMRKYLQKHKLIAKK